MHFFNLFLVIFRNPHRNYKFNLQIRNFKKVEVSIYCFNFLIKIVKSDLKFNYLCYNLNSLI